QMMFGGGFWTVEVTVLESFALFGSGCAQPAVTVFVKTVPLGTLQATEPVSVMVAEAPAVSFAIRTTRLFPAPSQTPSVELQEANVTAAGRTSPISTGCAGFAPVLVTVI